MKYRTFVHSLKRLYHAGRITDVRVTELYEKNRITEEEYRFIMGEDE